MRSISKTICALKLIRVAMLPLLLSAGACLNAQTASSTISGAVSDMSGAAISGAKVQVKNVDTGVSQTLTTDAEGRYRVPELVLEIGRAHV